VVERDSSGVRVVVTLTPAEATWPADCLRLTLDALDGEALGFFATQLTRGGAVGELTALQLTELTGGCRPTSSSWCASSAEGGAIEHAPTALPI
jgi:hypothetical protein